MSLDSQTVTDNLESLMARMSLQTFNANINQKERLAMTFLVYLSNLAKNAGVDIGPGEFKIAMREAGQTGKYDTPMDAANDQETWARANDIKNDGGWENHAKGVKREFD
jgi:hypothetical protein